MATYLGRFQVLAKPASEWASADPILLNGEIGVAEPGSMIPVLKVGDGVRPWSVLPPISGAGGGGPDYVVGSTTTLPPGSFATVTIDNLVEPPTISFGIPTGAAGPPNTLTMGIVTTGPAGSAASATITGTAPNQTLSLTIPRGDKGEQGDPGADGATGPAGPAGAAGPPNTLVIGTVTTGAPGSPADASITGTSPNQILNLTIPTGAQGPAGPPGTVEFGDPVVMVALTPQNGDGMLAMRADAAPALSQAIAPTWTGAHIFSTSIDLAGLVKLQGVEGTSGQVLASQGPGLPAHWIVPSTAVGANPSALVGLAAINGASANFMRADAAPALNQAITPTWTGAHTFDATVDLAGPLEADGAEGASGQVLSSQGPGLPAAWRNPGGGSIDLIFQFNSSTAAADPGAKHCSVNNAALASVTALYFDVESQSGFDVSGILGMLTAGNRIYMQQRQDASRAAIYQVTGPATNNTGWFTVPVSVVNATGAMFANNADVTTVFILASSGASAGNATGLVGLAPVNGSALTYLRSDAAPALSQAITPTWTGAHVFSSSIVVGAPSGGAQGAGTINAAGLYVNGVAVGAGASGGNPTAQVGLAAINGSSANFMRADAAPALNQGITPTWTGAHVFNSSIVVGAPAGGSKGAGTINATGLYINNVAVTAGGGVPGGSTTQVQYNNAGAFAGSAAFTWDDSTATLSIGTNALGGSIFPPSFAGLGTTLYLRGGPATGAANKGGTLNLQGGIPADGDGGDLVMSGRGGAGTNRNGGNIYLSSGSSSGTGTAGFIQITAAASATGVAGYLQFRTGVGAVDRLFINGNGSWGLGAAATVGTSGQVLTSQGAAPPIWTSLPAGVAGANPTGTIGLAAVNGVATTFLRSDGAPALSQAIVPTWSGQHTWTQPLLIPTGSAATPSLAPSGDTNSGMYSAAADQLGWSCGGSVAMLLQKGVMGIYGSTGGVLNIFSNAGTSDLGLSAGSSNRWILRRDSTAESGSNAGSNLNIVRCDDSGNALGTWASVVRSSGATTFTGGSFTFSSQVSAASFQSTSARALKRETGRPSHAADILARLRPVLYRLLAGDDREQLGMIAEEVHEVCPALSDGMTVAYDRLALLLLADWQQQRAAA